MSDMHATRTAATGHRARLAVFFERPCAKTVLSRTSEAARTRETIAGISGMGTEI